MHMRQGATDHQARFPWKPIFCRRPIYHSVRLFADRKKNPDIIRPLFRPHITCHYYNAGRKELVSSTYFSIFFCLSLNKLRKRTPDRTRRVFFFFKTLVNLKSLYEFPTDQEKRIIIFTACGLYSMSYRWSLDTRWLQTTRRLENITALIPTACVNLQMSIAGSVRGLLRGLRI